MKEIWCALGHELCIIFLIVSLVVYYILIWSLPLLVDLEWWLATILFHDFRVVIVLLEDKILEWPNLFLWNLLLFLFRISRIAVQMIFKLIIQFRLNMLLNNIWISSFWAFCYVCVYISFALLIHIFRSYTYLTKYLYLE